MEQEVKLYRLETGWLIIVKSSLYFVKSFVSESTLESVTKPSFHPKIGNLPPWYLRTFGLVEIKPGHAHICPPEFEDQMRVNPGEAN